MITGTVEEQLTPVVRLNTRSGSLKRGTRLNESELRFVVDTGFNGIFHLAIRDDLLRQIGAEPQFVGDIRLADGSSQSTTIYKLQVRWDDDWKDCLAVALKTPRSPEQRDRLSNLLGTGLLSGCRLQMDMGIGGVGESMGLGGGRIQRLPTARRARRRQQS